MIFGISWWGLVFIALVLIFFYGEYFGHTTEEVVDDEQDVLRPAEKWARAFMYVGAIILCLIYFQDWSQIWIKYVVWCISAVVLIVSSYYLLDELKRFAIDPHGKNSIEDGGEPAGVFFNVIGYSIPVALYVGAIYFSIFSGLKFNT